MKRTQQMNLASFRKVYRMAPLTLAVGAAIFMSGCGESNETASIFHSVEDCITSGISADQCKTAQQQSEIEAEKTAPKYASSADCAAEFGAENCKEVPAGQSQTYQSGGSFWMPMMMGYMMGRMGGSQPLFTSSAASSPAKGQFVDAAGRKYGTASAGAKTVKVPKSAMNPKPAVTRTITRGGFGQSVMKASSSSGSRSGIRSGG